jgi:hypothetical protein
MRVIPSAVAAISLACLNACAPAFEDGHLSRAINQQRVVRDKCLFSQAAALDDRSSTPETIGWQVSSACDADNDKLIQLVATMDRGNEEKIATVMRKDAAMKATSYVLRARTYGQK